MSKTVASAAETVADITAGTLLAVGDFALVHARLGDTDGNLVFNKAAMNFNPLAAMAGRICVAQVEELVEPGEIDPAEVHLPGVYVRRIVHTGPQTKHIEKRTVRESAA